MPAQARALAEAARRHNPNVELVELEDDNPLFSRPGYQGIGDDYELPLALDPRVIQTMADWVTKH